MALKDDRVEQCLRSCALASEENVVAAVHFLLLQRMLADDLIG